MNQNNAIIVCPCCGEPVKILLQPASDLEAGFCISGQKAEELAANAGYEFGTKGGEKAIE